MNIEDKLLLIRFNSDQSAHIKLNKDLCVDCEERGCLYVCPVNAYQIEGNEMTFDWSACLECGACRIVCSRGALNWEYPRGGFGVCFRYG
ncbi:MAG: 4Fe-4S binding protein [Chloroflexi bacterium]|nr:4Fe-4S binding protein [Chloroflexota bacterium]